MSVLPLRIGACNLFWLSGGDFRLDGGAMFGPVPKSLWQKRVQPDSENTILLCNDPLLIQTPRHTILVDTGLGNKLTSKEAFIFKVTRPWSLLSGLASLGFTRQDVDVVILTHCDFDHAGGVVMMNERGQQELTFPAAIHLIQKSEWEDVNVPGPRGSESYWPINFNKLNESGRIRLVDGDHQVCQEVRVCHTGGHTRGHQLVEIVSGGETAVHPGDLFPTHAHANPLWVMAYDNFPLDVIAQKERCLAEYGQREAWFTLYHDPLVKACKFGAQGQLVARWPPLP
jgi:glyoxylase-like metal-dependent hydrolase (beta-lactamase superfamily II)